MSQGLSLGDFEGNAAGVKWSVDGKTLGTGAPPVARNSYITMRVSGGIGQAQALGQNGERAVWPDGSPKMQFTLEGEITADTTGQNPVGEVRTLFFIKSKYPDTIFQGLLASEKASVGTQKGGYGLGRPIRAGDEITVVFKGRGAGNVNQFQAQAKAGTGVSLADQVEEPSTPEASAPAAQVGYSNGQMTEEPPF